MLRAATGHANEVSAQSLHRTIPARPESIGPLRRELLEFARHLGVVDPYALALAVSETVSNAIVHAYRGEGDGEIDVCARRDPSDGMHLTVSDRGCGMKPRSDSPGLGLGLPLMAHFAEEFEIVDRPEGGTRVRMRFAVAG